MDIVSMTLYALINAEELGITSGNIDNLKGLTLAIQTLLALVGTEGNMGELLGLGADWSYNAIKQVGNYGEIYERTCCQDWYSSVLDQSMIFGRVVESFTLHRFVNRNQSKTGRCPVFFLNHRIVL
jgi:hypothetical protein